MSSNGSADTKTLTLVSHLSSMEEKLQSLIPLNEGLANNLSYLVDMAQELGLSCVQLKGAHMDLLSISVRQRALLHEIYIARHMLESSPTGNKQDESSPPSLSPPLPPSGVPFKFPPTE